KGGHAGSGRGKKNLPTPCSKEDFNKIVDDFNKELDLSTPVSSRKRKIEMGETPKSKKGKKLPDRNTQPHKKELLAKNNETNYITLSSDEDETMEIPKENTLFNKDENDSITLSSDEEMEVDLLPKEVESAKPAIVIDFGDENLSIDFATTRNMRANIWRRAQIPLYQRDATTNTKTGEITPGQGQRFIEILWNKPTEWLNDAMVYAYLCYLATKASRKTVVVDSLATDVGLIQAVRRSTLGACFNYEPNVNTEVVIMPLFFPGHWVLCIHDVNIGTWLIDSIPCIPDRLNPSHPYYRGAEGRSIYEQRIGNIKKVLCDIFPSYSAEDIDINVLEPVNHSKQPDGCSCGYYVCWHAEAWLFNDRNLILDPINLVKEKRRILWHINQLYTTDDVEYHPRQGVSQNSLPVM
ncbi:MAG TPA: hypothetical protein VFV08_13345, partial [Puia sp.]|nr:hypothetical protein [Puia sp.]